MLVKFSDTGIQDVSTSISITVKFEEMTDDDDDNEDESDKHLEARDRRYSCLKTLLSRNFLPKKNGSSRSRFLSKYDLSCTNTYLCEMHLLAIDTRQPYLVHNFQIRSIIRNSLSKLVKMN